VRGLFVVISVEGAVAAAARVAEAAVAASAAIAHAFLAFLLRTMRRVETEIIKRQRRAIPPIMSIFGHEFIVGGITVGGVSFFSTGSIVIAFDSVVLVSGMVVGCLLRAFEASASPVRRSGN